MKLLKYYPYYTAVAFSCLMYYLIATDLVDAINHFIILFSTIIFTLVIARFYHLCFYKSFFISLSFYIIGTTFMYLVINHASPYTTAFHILIYPVFLGASILGITTGFLIAKRERVNC